MLEVEFGLLILRLVIGLLFVGHGTQKLFGWFGGQGLEGTASFFEKLDVYPAKFWAQTAALGETLGGLGLALGFLTPISAAVIVGVMLMAIIKVHWEKGMWITNNGMEYALFNLAVAAVLGLAGPGAYALDSLLNLNLPMPQTFIFALILVILGVLAGILSPNFVGEPEAGTQS